MGTCRSLILILLTCGSIALAQTTAPTTVPAIDAIRDTKDPSSAVEAYARGVAADPSRMVELEQAYVHHMVALGAPELADAQAHDLVGRNAADALTRGVAAYNDADRGNAPAALVNLKTGLSERPDDLFLLRTAGQIVAWYDGQADRSNLSKDDVAAIEWLRSAGTGREEFANAYRAASEARRLPVSTATQATTPAADVTPPTTYYYPAAERYTSYVPYEPYYLSGYYAPYYSYWPSSSIIILRDRDCDRHHRHSWFDRRGGFERGGGGFDRATWRGRTWNHGDNSPSALSPRGFVGPLPVNPTASRDAGTVRTGSAAQMGPQPRSDAGRASPAPSRSGSSASPAPRNSGGGGDRGGSRSGGSSGNRGGDSRGGSSNSGSSGGGRR